MHKIQRTAQVLFREGEGIAENQQTDIFSVLNDRRDFIRMTRKRSRNQCYLTLFFGIKRELAQTQTTLTSRAVNLTNVLNLKYFYWYSIFNK